jgi:hypothetical protein
MRWCSAASRASQGLDAPAGQACRRAWSFAEVSPQNVLGNFNGFLKPVILRISEARDLGEVDRFKFYDHSKALPASPPDLLRVNEKNLREHYVPNITTPARSSQRTTRPTASSCPPMTAITSSPGRCSTGRTFRGLLECTVALVSARRGLGHVGAYLRTLDLSLFDPMAPLPAVPATAAKGDAPDFENQPGQETTPAKSALRGIPHHATRRWRRLRPPRRTMTNAPGRALSFRSWQSPRTARRARPASDRTAAGQQKNDAQTVPPTATQPHVDSVFVSRSVQQSAPKSD